MKVDPTRVRIRFAQCYRPTKEELRNKYPEFNLKMTSKRGTARCMRGNVFDVEVVEVDGLVQAVRSVLLPNGRRQQSGICRMVAAPNQQPDKELLFPNKLDNEGNVVEFIDMCEHEYNDDFRPSDPRWRCPAMGIPCNPGLDFVIEGRCMLCGSDTRCFCSKNFCNRCFNKQNLHAGLKKR